MTNIKFYSQKSDSPDYPHIFIKRRQWDDYGYKTLFEILYYNSTEEPSVQIGNVKIGHYGQAHSPTQLPSEFWKLPEEYFSLGQSQEYYTKLAELGKTRKTSVLEGLRDLRLLHNHNKAMLSEDVIAKSLTRFLGPLNLLNEPLEADKNRLADESIERSHQFEIEFSCILQGSKESTSARFTFETNPTIPGRINLIIGKNGSGKTQFLANLVSTIIGMNSTGQVSSSRSEIQKVFAVSYSVFDRFFTPDETMIPGSRSRPAHLDQQIKYEYIGIREKQKNQKYSRIVGPNTLSRRFMESIRSIQERDDYEAWLKVMNPILEDAGLTTLAVARSSKRIREAFRKLGAGHKVSLSILSRLYSRIEESSLVVVDEPENHMHPSLLSATLHVLQSILEHRNSFAIISSHSPIIAQDTPAKHIRVLKRIEGISSFGNIQMETLGSSIDSIISYLFGVHSELPGYRLRLKTLANDNVTLASINKVLERELSVEASSYFVSMGGSIE